MDTSVKKNQWRVGPMSVVRGQTPLNKSQIKGFWAAWLGWVLDGMDSFIFALALTPALAELLPASNMEATPAQIGSVGSIMFAVFLLGWGMSFIWGPIADRFGRVRTLAASVLIYSVFTGAAAFADNIWELGVYRFLAGIGIGGEWVLAGTYVAEAWPEDRRKMGAGYFATGYYVGFFIAAALNYTVGSMFGWRAMLLCGFAPVFLSLYMLSQIKEPEKWKRSSGGGNAGSPMRLIFAPPYRTRTLVNSALYTVAIIGLWAGSVYEPTAIMVLAAREGLSAASSAGYVSLGTAILSVGSVLGCLAAPIGAEMLGRPRTLAIYFTGMALCISLSFGWIFYWDHGLATFIAILFFLGLFGGSFSLFSLWIPEQYPTYMRVTAFSFIASMGRFVGAGVNMVLSAAILSFGSAGIPVATTALAFLIGLALLPRALDTRGRALPD